MHFALQTAYQCDRIMLMKKSICLLSSIALLAAAVPFASCSKTAEVNYTLSEDGTHYIVSGVSGNLDSLAEYDIPASYCEEGKTPLPVTEIGDEAFKGCANLHSVTMPDSIEKIGALAFMMSALIDVEIPDSVTHIGVGAFSMCHSLTQVVIPQSVTTIQTRAFAYCSNLEEVKIYGSITVLEERVFYNSYKVQGGNIYTSTSLKKIYLPATLEKIATSALDGNLIEHIYFAGSKEQWKEVIFFETDSETGEEVVIEKDKVLPGSVEVHFAE